MSSPPVGRVKRGLLQLVWSLAASVFIGVSVYGVITYWGGEINQKVPAGKSLLLGLLAVICIVVIVYIGGLQDRIAHRDDQQDNSEQDME
jgi:formate hydrogenlyase subunit 3/multisubunit Na+/H+ antiporter MnhD subunit